MTDLPKQVLYILERIEALGHQAYLVGGCVRDLLLGRKVHDWDICTSMLPQDLLTSFDKTVPTGLKHGTVTVLHDHMAFEVTTFRTESAYTDHRKPDSVSFSSSLEEDLSRRDFTVNAMAMDRNGEVTDLFGGMHDLKAKVLRCVGEPMHRYTEDALRILRCVRFSAQLEFHIEARTFSAMHDAAPLCRFLSAERIRDEMEKILCSRSPEKLSILIGLGILERFGLKERLNLEDLKQLADDRLVRWCMLYDREPSLDLAALRLEKKLCDLAVSAYRCRDLLEDRISVKRAVYLYGRDAVSMSAVLHDSCLARSVLQSGECMEIRQLAVSGKDFPDVKGAALGELLRSLLYYIWEHPAENERDKLLSLANQFILS